MITRCRRQDRSPGGLIDDMFATYRWLYVGAWGIGLGAFLMALTSKPLPKVSSQLAASALT
jgi:hypothetical protein